jgi:ribosomal protein L15
MPHSGSLKIRGHRKSAGNGSAGRCKNKIQRIKFILKKEKEMNIPKITSIENALKIYYTNSEIGNKEITELFGRHSSTTVSRLKKIVKDEMKEKNILSYGMYKINTSVAFTVLGIDINDLEKRMKKIKELAL